MPTLSKDNIRSLLYGFARNNEYEGVGVNAIVNILAEAIYLNQTQYINITLERSFLTSRYLNSIIAHAVNRLYSVNRGYNQKIRFNNIKVIKELSVKKFDIMTTINGLNLYYVNNATYREGSYEDIEVVVGNTVRNYTSTTNAVNNNINRTTLMIDFLENNLSEHIKVYRGTGNNRVEMRVHREFSNYQQALGESDTLEKRKNNCLAITLPNYGVRIINEEGIGSDTYTLQAIPYTRSVIDPNIIRTISNYEIDSSVGAVPFTNIDRVNRVTDKNKIYYESTVEWKSGFVVRSNSDLLEVFKSVLTNLESDVVELKVRKVNDNIQLTYLRPDRVDSIPAELITSINNVKLAYYIDSTLTYVKATPHVSTPLNLQVKIFHTGLTTEDGRTINLVLKDFDYKIGEPFNPYRIISALNRLSKINAVEIFKENPTNVFTTPADIIPVGNLSGQIGQDNYPNINYSLVYINDEV